MGRQLIRVATLIVTIGTGVAACPQWGRAEVSGGYINTDAGRSMVLIDHSPTMRAVLGVSLAPIDVGTPRSTTAGQVFIVSPSGSWRATTGFSDRYGVRIAASSRANKLVYINDVGRIVGGLGLNQSELVSVARSFGIADLEALSGLAGSTQQNTLYDAVRTAVENVRSVSGWSDYQRSDAYVDSVGWLAGATMRDLADQIQYAAYYGSNTELAAIHEGIFGDALREDGQPLFTGVSELAGDAVSYGDNGGSGGGKGLVAYGDNGGSGGGKGVISYGDNGGSGGGKGIPQPVGLNTIVAGSLLFVHSF